MTQSDTAYYPSHGQTCKTLKNKFGSLYSHKKPTGIPTYPPLVQNTIQILDLINLEMDVTDGEGSGDIAADDNTGENVPEGVPALPTMETMTP